MGKNTDPVMIKVLKLFEESGKTLDQLGQEMGYQEKIARKAAWQFLKKTLDPHISMLRKFAKAMGVSIHDLVENSKEK